MKKLIISIILLTSFNSYAVPTTIIVSRHAEKAAGDNPDLTKDGKKRAKALTELKHLFKITQVYSSDTKRTIATAEPIAKEMNLIVNTSFGATQYESMMTDISKNHSGTTVMVVGHSDTIPGFLNYLTKSNLYKEIDSTDYSNLFIIQYEAPGKAVVHRYREVVDDDKLSLEPRGN